MKILKNGKLVKRKTNPDLDRNRVRFNWGYHDAAMAFVTKHNRQDGLTVENIEAGHFDPIYAKGWVAGWNDSVNGEYQTTSRPAWIDSRLEDGYADHQIPMK
jgi:hypothetical protein